MPDTIHRVLVLAPIGRDGPSIAISIGGTGPRVDICNDLDALTSSISDADAVVLAEEGLFGQDYSDLTRWVRQQPPWSDLPFVILTSRQELSAVKHWRRKLMDDLGNVSLLERPVQTITLVSTVQAALRARRRQHEVRELLARQEREAYNLEAVVLARTAELEHANEELRAEMAKRAQMEEALRQAQKIEAIGQLTGGVAHDFNNLLMVISGGLQMLERQTNPDRRRRLMDGMRQATTRGAALTRQLLAFSRRRALQPEAIDLRVQIDGMHELLERALRGDVHVELSFPKDLWPVEADPGELELVVLNLALNARDAMPEGGTIRISAENVAGSQDVERAGDFVRLSVADYGVGMSDEVKAHVFEPFYTTKEVGRGSGLGLAQVHRFAKQSGGTVRIESELGKGTSVELYLPRSYRTPARVAAHAMDVPGKSAHAGRSVLLVEDDDEVAALVTEMLEHLGCGVTRVASAVAALGALSNGRAIDLIFSDVMMPGSMNGIDLAREVHNRRKDLPILLCSGYVEAVQEKAAVEGVRLLPKPYRLEELDAALGEVMYSRR